MIKIKAPIISLLALIFFIYGLLGILLLIYLPLSPFFTFQGSLLIVKGSIILGGVFLVLIILGMSYQIGEDILRRQGR